MLEEYWNLRKEFFDKAKDAELVYMKMMSLKKILGDINEKASKEKES
jgi:hypothetical protein